METRKIIFATTNEGKIKEIKEIMSELGDNLISMKEAGIKADIDENGSTFEENAIIKAREVCAISGEIVLADDSGLEVDYMNGEPGVYSARYLGTDTSYAVKNATIIENLRAAIGRERRARFVCAIAAAFPDGRVFTTRGTIEGIIGHEELGENGFGYDPIFYVPEYSMTTAQMDAELKNKISHRSKALRLMKEKLQNEGINC